jgi:hypothetical protein
LSLLIEPGSISSLYQRAIQDTGRESEFLFLVSFLFMFGFIRTSAHMIRAQVSWWPGNVNVGGTHIHHLVWGILLVLIFGYVGAVVRPESPWSEIAVVAFGLGTGLTMDEFALWLNLRDVYWEKEGRRSIDAVIVVGAIAAFALVGFGAWVDVADSVESGVFAAVGAIGGLGLLMAIINAAKEKFWVAGFSIVFPLAGVVGLFRLAKPGSLWAHHLYGEKKLRRSRERFGAPPTRSPTAPEHSGALDPPAASG